MNFGCHDSSALRSLRLSERLTLLGICWEQSILVTALHPLPVEARTLAGAEAAQRAVLAGGVGTLEDPVLPGGEPAEDLGLHRLRPAAAQVGLHARERVRRQARPLLDRQAHLVLEVDLVVDKGHQAERLRLLGPQRLVAASGGRFQGLGMSEETALQPSETVG